MVIIDVVYVFGMDDCIGSIEFGKYVDFVVLEDNLFEVLFEMIYEIEVWGIVFVG